MKEITRENEIWKDIKGYEGLYQISNYGRVKALEKLIKAGIRNNGFVKRKEKIKKIQINELGYCHTSLGKYGKSYNVNIHKLVAEAFLDRKDFKYMPDEDPTQVDLEKLEVNHKDENPSNNNVDNLEWCTRSYNINYGTRNQKVSENMIRNKRYAKPVIQYNMNWEVIKVWRSLKAIEKELGYSRSGISCCCKGVYSQAKGYIWRFYETNN